MHAKGSSMCFLSVRWLIKQCSISPRCIARPAIKACRAAAQYSSLGITIAYNLFQELAHHLQAVA